jgi:diguanylate cyclase (GGDEF)-like protein
VSESEGILVLGDRRQRDQLTARLGDDGQVRYCGDAYEALLEMGRRRWPVVVLTAPTSDLRGLCRGARRLQPDAQIFSICDPADEPKVGQMVGEDLLDDYFVRPLSSDDLARLSMAASTPRLARVGGEDESGHVVAREIVHLVESSTTLESLEQGVAEVVSRRLDVEADWVDADRASGREPLLLAVGSRPRVLVARRDLRAPQGAARAFLTALQQCMPALVVVARRTESLRHQATTDHLTGTQNRRYFYQTTDDILREAGTQGFSVTLLLYDIDNFKHYNDTYGYAAGDEILRETAALMKQITRSQDIVARIGGDEFAVLFWDRGEPRAPGSRPPETARALADRFRRVVETHMFPSLGPEARGALTISGGLANYPADGRTCRELLRQADRAIKAAKRSGKNGIQLVGDPARDEDISPTL